MTSGRRKLIVLAIAVLGLGAWMLGSIGSDRTLQADARTAAKPDTQQAATRSLPAVARQPGRAASLVASRDAGVGDGSSESPECIAGRARDAAANAKLAAMTPAELEAQVDAAARNPPPPDSLFTRTAQACAHLAGPRRSACHGKQFLALYLLEDLDEKAVHDAMRTHARQVARRGDARSLIAAAEIMPIGAASATGSERTSGLGRSAEAIEWVVRAQRLGQDDALVQWSVADFSHSGVDGLSPELRRAQMAAVRQLTVLEPDNAAALLLAISFREDGSTAIPTPAQLQRAAAMPRFSEPAPARIALGLDALGGVPALPAFRRVALRANREFDTATHCASHAELVQQLFLAERRAFWSSGLPTSPSFACIPGEGRWQAPPVEACLELFEKIHGSAGRLSERGVAAIIATNFSTTASRRAQWRRVARREQWQSSQHAALLRSVDPYVLARFAAEGWRNGSEIHGMQALLRSRGIPLDPPEGWKAPGEP